MGASGASGVSRPASPGILGDDRAPSQEQTDGRARRDQSTQRGPGVNRSLDVVARGGGLEPPIDGPEPPVLPITPPPNGPTDRSQGRGSGETELHVAVDVTRRSQAAAPTEWGST